MFKLISKFLLLFFVLFFNIHGFSQTPKQKIDSLEKWFTKYPKKDTTWINNLCLLERLYLDVRSPKKNNLGFQILEISKKINYHKGVSKGLRYIAYQYADDGKYPEALKVALERLAYNQKYNLSPEIIDSYNAMMYVHAMSGDVKKALDAALVAKKEVELLPKSDPEWFIAFSNTFSGLGNLYIMLDETEKAINIYTQVLSNIDNGIKKNRLSLSNIQYLKGVAYANLANLYSDIAQYQLSMQYAKKALALSEQHDIKLLLPPLLNTLVLSSTNIGAYTEAEKYLAMNEEFRQKNKLQKDEVLDYYEMGRDLYFAEKKYEQAYKYQTQYYILKDSIQGTDVQNKLNELTTKYETEKKEAQIKTLEREKTLKNYLLAAILVFVIGLVGAFWNRYKAIQLEKVLMRQDAILQQEKAEKLQLEMDNKQRELASSTLYLEQRNGFLDSLRNQIKNGIEPKRLLIEIDRNMSLEEDWQNFKLHFEQVHPSFFEKLLHIESTLTDLEQKQCAYLKLNLSPKQVSNLLNVTPHAVSVSRTRIKKKLGLEEEMSLNDFLAKL